MQNNDITYVKINKNVMSNHRIHQSKSIAYTSRYFIFEGEVLKAFNQEPSTVTPEVIEELKRNYSDITIQNGKEIKMYFSREGMERLDPRIFSTIPKDYDITIYVGETTK